MFARLISSMTRTNRWSGCRPACAASCFEQAVAEFVAELGLVQHGPDALDEVLVGEVLVEGDHGDVAAAAAGVEAQFLEPRRVVVADPVRTVDDGQRLADGGPGLSRPRGAVEDAVPRPGPRRRLEAFLAAGFDHEPQTFEFAFDLRGVRLARIGGLAAFRVAVGRGPDGLHVVAPVSLDDPVGSRVRVPVSRQETVAPQPVELAHGLLDGFARHPPFVLLLRVVPVAETLKQLERWTVRVVREEGVRDGDRPLEAPLQSQAQIRGDLVQPQDVNPTIAGQALPVAVAIHEAHCEAAAPTSNQHHVAALRILKRIELVWVAPLGMLGPPNATPGASGPDGVLGRELVPMVLARMSVDVGTHVPGVLPDRNSIGFEQPGDEVDLVKGAAREAVAGLSERSAVGVPVRNPGIRIGEYLAGAPVDGQVDAGIHQEKRLRELRHCHVADRQGLQEVVRVDLVGTVDRAPEQAPEQLGVSGTGLVEQRVKWIALRKDECIVHVERRNRGFDLEDLVDTPAHARTACASGAAGGERVEEGERVDVLVPVVQELGDAAVLLPRDFVRACDETLFADLGDPRRELMEPRHPVEEVVHSDSFLDRRQGR